MLRFLFVTFVSAACLLAAEDPVIFRTNVALTRVDAQVVDSEGRVVTNLVVDDFVLSLNGKSLPIRNFAREELPIDVLLLLDVSGSMQSHVQRIAAAAHDALNVLSDKDRVAVMVFDSRTRVRLPFESSHTEITKGLNRILQSETFSGGTRITQSLLEAANYVARNARPEARRAIVILTDDQTQDSEDEPRVESALTRANAVLSFLQAPYNPHIPYGGGGGGGRRHGGGTWGSGGGGWPGSGGIGFPGGGSPPIWGSRGPGGYGGVDQSHSAGTATIAADTGGDTMPVQTASALEDTLARLRQRYGLYYYLPENTVDNVHAVQVDLSEHARLRYNGAEVRARRVYLAGDSPNHTFTEPAVVTRVQQRSPEKNTDPEVNSQSTTTASKERRKAVNENSGPSVNTMSDGDSATQEPVGSSAPAAQNTNGWPRVHPKEPQP